MLIVGRRCSGKTMLAQALGRFQIQHSHKVVIWIESVHDWSWIQFVSQWPNTTELISNPTKASLQALPASTLLIRDKYINDRDLKLFLDQMPYLQCRVLVITEEMLPKRYVNFFHQFFLIGVKNVRLRVLGILGEVPPQQQFQAIARDVRTGHEGLIFVPAAPNLIPDKTLVQILLTWFPKVVASLVNSLAPYQQPLGGDFLPWTQGSF